MVSPSYDFNLNVVWLVCVRTLCAKIKYLPHTTIIIAITIDYRMYTVNIYQK